MNFLKKLSKKAGSSKKGGKMDARKAAHSLLADKMDLNTNTIMYEYDRLRRYDDQPSLVGRSKANARCNRYCDVIPFDANRVVLNEGPSDYINASFVRSRPGDSPTWAYIVCQGPLEHTAADFWRMVYEQKSNVIIMLTRVMEDFIEKCYQYFPEKEGATARHGDYYVEVQSQFEVSSDVTGRTLVLANQKSGSWRKVTHYQYHAWPDHGTLQVTGPIRNLCRLVQGHRLTGLPVVHCSAGIGRSGTFCTIDIILRNIDAAENREEAERAVDVKRVVSYLRKQRYGMVQTPAQYHFCHQAVREDLQEKLGAPVPQPLVDQEATVINRGYNPLTISHSDIFQSSGQLQTIIESDDL